MGAPRREAAHTVSQQQEKDGLLDVQAVFRLVEDNRPRRIYDGIGYFFAAVRRQAMHKNSVRSGAGK
jgi:hypothetical protein